MALCSLVWTPHYVTSLAIFKNLQISHENQHFWLLLKNNK